MQQMAKVYVKAAWAEILRTELQEKKQMNAELEQKILIIKSQIINFQKQKLFIINFI